MRRASAITLPDEIAAAGTGGRTTSADAATTAARTKSRRQSTPAPRSTLPAPTAAATPIVTEPPNSPTRRTGAAREHRAEDQRHAEAPPAE